MKKYTAFLFLLLLAPTVVATPAAFETKAGFAYLIDMATGRIILEKNAHQPTAPSSMSKLMTIYLAFERLKNGSLHFEDTFLVSERAWRMGGSRMFVNLGEQVSVADLLRGMIVQSGNDACVVLAEGMMGSEEAFVDTMNDKATALGLKESHFMNATGWPHDEHVMSAYDLALLAQRLILDFPDLYPMFAETTFTHNNITQPNRNMLLGRNIGVDGLKTGHADKAGFGIVLSAKQKQRRLLLVINGLRSMAERSHEAERLLNYGFQQFTLVTPFVKGQQITRVPIWMGNKNQMGLVAATDVVVTVPRFAKRDYRIEAHYNQPIIAPVQAGDVLGELRVIQGSGEQQLVETFPLVAQESATHLPPVMRAISRTQDIVKSILGK
jgi:D-alanyl-D-alanine carboxypeptidase (penicillin-binding protein 5/6)